MAAKAQPGSIDRCGPERSPISMEPGPKKELIQQLGHAVSNLTQWLASHESLLPQPLSLWTLKRILKQAGFRWKRVRKSLKAQQDAILMSFLKDELNALNQPINGLS